MRYDKVLAALEKARTVYENSVRETLAQAIREDAEIEQALINVGLLNGVKKDPKGRAAKSAAWTPARRRKQSRLMKKRNAERRKK